LVKAYQVASANIQYEVNHQTELITWLQQAKAGKEDSYSQIFGLILFLIKDEYFIMLIRMEVQVLYKQPR